jgi:hypothetical protein
VLGLACAVFFLSGVAVVVILPWLGIPLRKIMYPFQAIGYPMLAIGYLAKVLHVDNEVVCTLCTAYSAGCLILIGRLFIPLWTGKRRKL